jgi:hypothetical protein
VSKVTLHGLSFVTGDFAVESCLAQGSAGSRKGARSLANQRLLWGDEPEINIGIPNVCPRQTQNGAAEAAPFR